MTYATYGKCHNANHGTFGHECGKPAAWVGTNKVAPVTQMQTASSMVPSGSSEFSAGALPSADVYRLRAYGDA